MAMVDRDAVRRGYDALGTAYTVDRSLSTFEVRLIEDLLGACPDGGQFLDAGCGPGTALDRLLDAGRAVGADLSRTQLSLAREHNPRARLVQADLTRLPFGDDCFHGAVALHSLIHIPLDHHQSVLSELARVLQPGGRLLVTEGPDEWEGSNPDWLDAGVEMSWAIAGVEATRDQLDGVGFDCLNTRREEFGDEESWVYFECRRRE